MPVEHVAGRDCYDLEKVLPWLAERGIGIQAAAPEPQTDLATVQAAARARKMQADAALSELCLAERRGKLVAIDDVVLVVASHVSAARSVLLALPSKLAPLLAAEDTAAACEKILAAEIRAALSELADMPIENSGGAPPL